MATSVYESVQQQKRGDCVYFSADVRFGSPLTVTSVPMTGQSGDRSLDDSCGPRARLRYGRRMNCEILLLLGLVGGHAVVQLVEALRCSVFAVQNFIAKRTEMGVTTGVTCSPLCVNFMYFKEGTHKN
jgi:hypothetical protein